YVFSGMPAHLIHVPSVRLVDRDEVFNMFKPAVEAITEDELKNFSGPSRTRKETLNKVLRDKIKFAMLSHRWLDTGEPTFQGMSELQEDMSKNSAGYHKLTKFCEKAREYDCQLAWSDTCCINKNSSAELDEAIQAMFNWYHNAAICIAYLASSSSVSDFAQEPWFTRGWTLQELLAPEKMKFYGKNWEPLSDNLDDKHPRDLTTPSEDEISTPVAPSQSDILTAITRLTEIERHDLVSFSRGIHNVHQRLRWASRRTTTRIEDMAYSLIGIFDISLSITYGEGQRSWFRLMEIILQQCKSWEVFVW
ncbi:heterokaryon incompatibility protein-domain-containing protein, partial [Suillus plorans]